MRLSLFFKRHIKAIIAIIMLIALYRYGVLKLGPLVDSLKKPEIIISGLLLISFQFLFFAWRWKTVLSHKIDISLLQSFKLHQVGQFFNTFIPGGVGGDVVKAIALSTQKEIPKKITIGSVAVDKILGLYFMISFSMVFLIIEAIKDSQFSVIFQFTLTSVIFFLLSSTGLFAVPWMIRILNSLKNSLKSATAHKIADGLIHLLYDLKEAINLNTLFWTGFYSFCAQLFSIGFLYFSSQSLLTSGIHISFLLFFALSCFTFMATAIPLTPGGIGLGQAVIFVIFKNIDQELATQLVTSMSLMQLFMIILSLPGWFYFLLLKKQNSL